MSPKRERKEIIFRPSNFYLLLHFVNSKGNLMCAQKSATYAEPIHRQKCRPQHTSVDIRKIPVALVTRYCQVTSTRQMGAPEVSAMLFAPTWLPFNGIMHRTLRLHRLTASAVARPAANKEQSEYIGALGPYVRTPVLLYYSTLY